MSLLIKALRKAEQSKDAVTESVTPPYLNDKELELELAPDVAAEGRFDLGVESGLGEPVAKAADRAKQQQAAAVFGAKQDAGATGNSQVLWLGLGGLVFLLLVGGGFYYYLESLRQSPLQVAAHPAPIAVPPAPAAAAPAASSGATEAQQAAVGAGAPAEPAATVEEPLIKTRVEPAPPATPENLDAAPAGKAAVTSPAADKPAAPAEDAAVKVTRNKTPAAAVNSSVMAAYQAFGAGDDAAAERLYRHALQSEPRNIDALLGLAAVAARRDDAGQAVANYLRVLELEPRNPVAQAGLVGLGAQADPLASESRLKTMLAQQPEAAFLHAALGNLHADQEQWPLAQQSYFQAFRHDPSNAEYAFNLAVSLDHMGKGKLALENYQRALELLPKRGAATLDRAAVERRIAQLQASTEP